MDKQIFKKAVDLAIETRKNSYAPFSNFLVGAVVVTEKGKLFQGVNVENSSYGATVCAERNALFNAITTGERDFEAVVIASCLNGKAVFPCGICRQVLADFNPKMRVILVNSETKTVEADFALDKIFPHVFEFHRQ